MAPGQNRNERRQSSEEVIAPLDVQRAAITMCKFYLKQYNLDKIKVAEEVDQVDASYWNNRLTLGVLGLDDEQMALLASSKQKSSHTNLPIDMLLVTPGSMDGSLVFDRESHQPAARFFLTLEDDTIHAVAPSRPVPIDLVLPNYTHYDMRSVDSDFVLIDKLSHDYLSLKFLAKFLMGKNNIPNPFGFVASKENQYHEMFKKFVSLDQIKGIVIKHPIDHQSKGVRIYDKTPEGIKAALEYMEQLVQETNFAVVEERIFPTNLPGIEKPLDWNVRSLIFATEDGVTYLGSLLRVNDRSNKPVSISSGAIVASIPADWEERIIKPFVEEQSAKFASLIREQGGRPRGIWGLDLICKPGEKPGDISPLIMEPNGWMVGGFIDLCGLFKKPLSSVGEILIPHARNVLTKNYLRRNNTGIYDSIELPDYEFWPILLGLSENKERSKVLTFINNKIKTIDLESQFAKSITALEEELRKEPDS